MAKSRKQYELEVSRNHLAGRSSSSYRGSAFCPSDWTANLLVAEAGEADAPPCLAWLALNAAERLAWAEASAERDLARIESLKGKGTPRASFIHLRNEVAYFKEEAETARRYLPAA
jgi:hypothetical protein